MTRKPIIRGVEELPPGTLHGVEELPAGTLHSQRRM